MRLERFSDLYAGSGPMATVLLDVSRDSEDAAHLVELRWRAAREELAGHGAPDELLDAIGRLFAEPTHVPGAVSRLVVASGGEVRTDELVPEHVDPGVVTYADLPDLATWIELQDGAVPVLLVLADREGADLELYRALAEAPVERAEVHGDTVHINKVRVGGWAHLRYQHHTEELWRRNARQVADEIERHVAHGLGVVVIAGDVHARKNIEDALGGRASDSVIEVEAGGRAEGASREALDDAVREAVSGVVAERQLGLLREFEQRRGRDEAVAVGTDAVLDAFVRGQVDTLLLHPAAAREGTVDPTTYPGLPLPTASPQRRDLALVAAAALTSASVVTAGETLLPDDGVAALLRWDQPTG